jgi:short subunit dehydrogenase-like uncharacterized protein
MRISVLGANGYTGRLVCEQLEKNAIPFTAAVRSADSFAPYSYCLKVLECDVLNRQQIISVLDEADIIINCIGPYNLLSMIIIDEVKKRPLYYFDLTGEQSFVKASMDDPENKACLIHSCSFESALVDLLSFKVLDKTKEYKSINSFYHFVSPTPSPGTRFTIKVHGFFDQYCLQEGELVKVHNPFILNDLRLPGISQDEAALFAPYPEVLFLKKHFKVQSSASYMIMDKTMAMLAVERSGPRATLEEIIQRSSRIKGGGPATQERREQVFTIFLVASDSQGKTTVSSLTGKDMYMVTAGLILEGIKLLLHRPPPLQQVLTPAEAFYGMGLFEMIIEKYSMELTK